MRNPTKTVRTFGFMVVATMMGKILGLVRIQLFAKLYGKGLEADAYTAASQIPFIFFQLVLGAAVTSSFIPVFNDILKKKDKKSALRFANNFLNIAILISIVLAMVGVLCSGILIKLVAGGLSGHTYELAVQLTGIMFPMMIFAVIAFVFVGILQSFDEFNIPAAISVVSNIVLIIYLLFFNDTYGITGLAVAMVISWSVQMVVQIPFLKKKGYRYHFVIDFKCDGIKKIMIVILPILISTWVQPISEFVNLNIASFIDKGNVAILGYASKLYLIIVGIFTLAIGNLIYPSLARSSVVNQVDQFRKTLASGISAIIYIMLPLTIGLIILRIPLVTLLYQRGKFDVESTMLTQDLLLYYSIGMVGYGIKEVMNKAFYAIDEAKITMRIAVVGILVNIILSIVLSKFMKLSGLALSSAISVILIAVLLLIYFRKKHANLVQKADLINLIKIIISAVFMGILTIISFNIMKEVVGYDSSLKMLLTTVITTLVGCIVYFGFTLLLRVEQSMIFIRIVLSRIKK